MVILHKMSTQIGETVLMIKLTFNINKVLMTNLVYGEVLYVSLCVQYKNVFIEFNTHIDERYNLENT